MEHPLLRMETVTPYGPPFIFCARENLPLWKGARFGYKAHFNPRIDEYWMEMNAIDRQLYFFTFSGFESDRAIPPGFYWCVPHQLEEYYCDFGSNTWGIFHEKPNVLDHKLSLPTGFHETKLGCTITITDQGAILFPAWMSGADLMDYEFGLHKYTDKQAHHDLIVMDLEAGDYSVFVLFPEGNSANRDALGFMMRKVN